MRDHRTSEELFPGLERTFARHEALRQRYQDLKERYILFEAQQIERRRKHEARARQISTLVTILRYPFHMIMSLRRK